MSLINVAGKRDYPARMVKSDVIIRRDTLYRMSDAWRSVYYWLTYGAVIQAGVCSASVGIRGRVITPIHSALIVGNAYQY